ncbi:hypothetical protein TCAL_00446 [Tigriopus californicus]|uniref:Nudix hydrolase domain-containing protein n=1 Tax=Tigriopus californicus TaxID=6832 RepID=A0A553NF91_TIGCA|nr:acyl-coenzyme A diphosphatase NUDT19-like [Tigriopus californicus]TRY64117.1 hypothetical protein TCAL_00446 [Tigriopus californicus]|eukprot:TCALIF_00446-PA protein Name:"Similar to nudt19 Nucleoside diphosphate-linked moiety X motif 19, mitochondrial (Xenopus laevis)" AED:0.04 eAED:0.04 QI:0/-1/0/1/-1/1/1/0/366
MESQLAGHIPQIWSRAGGVQCKAKLFFKASLRIKMKRLPWKESATTILIAKSTKTSTTFNYKVLMLKRSGKSQFMPNTFVFPGGKIDQADFHPGWKDIFASSGKSISDIIRSKPQEPFLIQPKDEDDREGLHRRLAFRICALRETFEECGVLSIVNAKADLDLDKLRYWRTRVDQNASSFLQMCQESQLCPDVWSLHETSDWLTPVGRKELGTRRFDTIFYSHFLPQIPLQGVSFDDKEVTELCWTEPLAMLEDAKAGKLELAPPQVYEFTRMARFEKIEDLEKDVSSRAKQGVSTTFPVLFKCPDCTLSVLPGDELYPETPDFQGKQPGWKPLEWNFQQLNQKFPKANRIAIFNKHNIVPFVQLR